VTISARVTSPTPIPTAALAAGEVKRSDARIPTKLARTSGTTRTKRAKPTTHGSYRATSTGLPILAAARDVA
jgi:hypothetical protein